MRHLLVLAVLFLTACSASVPPAAPAETGPREPAATETPKAEAPKAEAPKAEVPKAEAPKARTPKAEAPKVEPPKAQPLKPAEAASDSPVAQGLVAVLMYHHLAPEGERSEESGVITPERFEQHLKLLKAEGYHFISARQFGEYLQGRLTLTGRSILLTFDDGYESNYTLAYPIMKRHAVPSIIFPVARFFDTEGKGAWSPHLTREQAQEMLASGLVEFGGHSYDGHGTIATAADGKESGPWLAARAWLTDLKRSETVAEYRARIRADLNRNKEILRALGILDQVLHFALPNGQSTPEELEELQLLGFTYIYTTDESGINRPGSRLIFRLDAGSPHITPQRLKERLDALFRR